MAVAASARDALTAAVDALRAAGCDTPELDAELLVADALGVDRATLVADRDRDVSGAAARLIGERIRRRVLREPVAYILGRKGFRHIELAVDPRALIPRPETELLVEVALELPAGARVHEVGTGSGAVGLALRDGRGHHPTASEPLSSLRRFSSASSAFVNSSRSPARIAGMLLRVTFTRWSVTRSWGKL